MGQDNFFGLLNHRMVEHQESSMSIPANKQNEMLNDITEYIHNHRGEIEMCG
jgi:hypothetical protein